MSDIKRTSAEELEEERGIECSKARFEREHGTISFEVKMGRRC